MKWGGQSNDLNSYDCTLIENAKKNNDIICNPIIDWTDTMVWDYINQECIKTNELYKMGYKRVGCIGCPMGNKKGMAKQFEDFPQIKQRYINAFQKMIDKRIADGLKTNWNTGEECFNWWIGNKKK